MCSGLMVPELYADMFTAIFIKDWEWYRRLKAIEMIREQPFYGDDSWNYK